MTGFGKGEYEDENWKATVILKSVNGKGLDIHLKAPSFLIPLEPAIREILKENIRRGSVTVSIDLESKQILTPVNLQKLILGVETIKIMAEEMELHLSHDQIFEFAWKLSEKQKVELDESVESVTMQAFQRALEGLKESRIREGNFLAIDIKARAEKIENILENIRKDGETYTEDIRKKIAERAQELKLNEDSPVVLNEIVFLLQRMDIQEEITRLESHIKELKNLIERDGEVGRKMEFLAQEMHREVNTIGSKMPDLGKYVVEMKTEIDRIKQQSANIE